MNNWEKVKLSTLCFRIGDGLHGTPNYIESGDIYFINGNNIKGGKIVVDNETKRVTEEELDKNFVELNSNSLLLSINGTLGNMAFFNGENVMLGKSAAYLNFKTDINRFYFYYFQLPSIQKYFYDVATGSTIKNLSLKSLQDFEVPKPTVNDYKKIAKVLSDLDAKIELNNKINAELEAMAKTLYDYWFVQFDFPDANGKPYKSSGGKMVWNEDLKREIPEGWEIIELGKDVSVQRGISYKSSEINGDGISMISLNSFNLDGTYKPEGIKKYSGKYAEKNLVSAGDLLIAITDVTRNADIIGKSIIVPDYYSDLVISMDIAKVIPGKKLTVSYLMMLFNSNHYHNYIKWYASGTIVLHLNLDGMNWYKAEIPPKYLLDKFDDFYKPIAKRINETKKQNQELASLRDWLLPMLMNGQVSVTSTNSSEESYEVEDKTLGMVAEPGIRNLSLQEKKLRRKMLATFIVNQSLSDTRFGKTKFEKLLHLIEYHIVKDDFNQKYSVQTAGPYDGGFTKLYWDEVLKAKWFKIEELGNLKRIVPGENHSKSLVEYNYFSAELKESISQFISLFKSQNYEKAEIVSTLFAVWNNRIINNEMITDALLKKDFLEWDKQKVKYADHLDKALAWMKKENIIPDGWGKYINRAKGK